MGIDVPQLSKALGAGVLRTEDARLLTGRGRYIADLDEPLLAGAAHAVFVRSTVAHGELVAVDVDDARSMPGVLGVFTAADVDIGPVPGPIPMFPPEMSAPVLAHGRVRYAGEPVAAVVAMSVAAAQDAAEAVVVDVEPLPVVLGPEAAARGDVVLFPEVGTNIASEFSVGEDVDDLAELFVGCEVVVRQRIAVPRLAAVPLEGRVCASVWDGDGRLHHWLSVQAPHSVKAALARLFTLEPEQVHVIAPDVGGGFGPKISGYPEDVFVAWAARALQRPVRWTETRSENLVGLHHGRGQVIDAALGGTRDGHIEAYAIEVLGDAGAYTSLGAYTVSATLRMTTGAYAIPRAAGRSVRAGHEHHTDDRVPRCRTTRGRERDRACSSTVRAHHRRRSRRGAPAQLRSRRRVPVHDPGRHGVRLRRLRGCARSGARGCRLRRAAGRAGGAAHSR